jgi:hypothetical protein
MMETDGETGPRETPAWTAFEDGGSIGETGGEGGVVLRDDEHPWGARITLERGAASREKVLAIADLTPDEFWRRLGL